MPTRHEKLRGLFTYRCGRSPLRATLARRLPSAGCLLKQLGTGENEWQSQRSRASLPARRSRRRHRWSSSLNGSISQFLLVVATVSGTWSQISLGGRHGKGNEEGRAHRQETGKEGAVELLEHAGQVTGTKPAQKARPVSGAVPLRSGRASGKNSVQKGFARLA